jgi:Putative peptidoglycan-binding domain-containing protein
MKTVITILFLFLIAVIAVPVQAQESSSTGSTPTTTGSDTMSSASHGTSHHRHMSHGSSMVREVQQALKDKGNDPGAVDGKLGPKTKAAIRDFQKANDLKVTGRIDKETKSKLGVGSSPQSATS